MCKRLRVFASMACSLAVTLCWSAAYAENTCYAEVTWDSTNIYGLHSVEADNPPYNEWVFDATLKRSGQVVDTDVESNPEEAVYTQTNKINCNIYKAITDADFETSTGQDDSCLASDSFNLQMGGECD